MEKSKIKTEHYENVFILKLKQKTKLPEESKLQELREKERERERERDTVISYRDFLLLLISNHNGIMW